MPLEHLPPCRVLIEVTLEPRRQRLAPRHGAPRRLKGHRLWGAAAAGRAADVERSVRSAEAQWRQLRELQVRSELLQRAVQQREVVEGTLDWLDPWLLRRFHRF